MITLAIVGGTIYGLGVVVVGGLCMVCMGFPQGLKIYEAIPMTILWPALAVYGLIRGTKDDGTDAC